LGVFGYVSTETVYGNAELPFILAVVSITSVISGFNSIYILLLNRKLNLGKLTLINFTSQFIGVIFTVLWAWYKTDIWALVFGGIVSSGIKMLLSHSLNLGAKCCFCWDNKAAHEIIHFGKWIFISSILGFFLNQGDRVLLGLWVTPEVLGVYSIAFFLAMALKDIIKKVIASVFYPMLSEVVRERPDELKYIYYKIREKVDFITMSSAGLMASMGHLIINALYDDRYIEAGWMIEILSIALVFVGYSMAGVCLMAKGDVKSNVWLILVAVIFLYISLPIAYYYYGIYGVIVMISLNYIIDIPSTFYMLRKNNLLSIGKEFKMIPILFIFYIFGNYLMSIM